MGATHTVHVNRGLQKKEFEKKDADVDVNENQTQVEKLVCLQTTKNV